MTVAVAFVDSIAVILVAAAVSVVCAPVFGQVSIASVFVLLTQELRDGNEAVFQIFVHLKRTCVIKGATRSAVIVHVRVLTQPFALALRRIAIVCDF